MSDEKKFTIAGTSTLSGVNTFRFATGKIKTRVAKLKKNDHTDVDLVELPSPMTKTEAVAWLITQGRDAVIPTNRKAKPIELTEEQKAEAAKAKAKEDANRKKREARAAAKMAKNSAADANYLAGLTGGTPVEVPTADAAGSTGNEGEGDGDDTASEKPEEADAGLAGAEEFLSKLAEDAPEEPKAQGEMGVDAEREAAGQPA